MPLVYLDASALVKSVRAEEEEGGVALQAYLQGADLVSSELVLTELPRALHRVGAENPDFQLAEGLERAEETLDRLALRPVDEALLIGAGMLAAPFLRSLDAVHVVTALLLAPLDAFVTYDKLQADAIRLAGLQAVSPGVDG